VTINRVVVLDPGKTTGLVDWMRGGEPEFKAMELNFDDTCRYLLHVGSAHGMAEDVLIVSESFVITPQTAKNTQAPWSLELIGVARMVSNIYLGRPLILQQPASAKRFSSDSRLKRMGWWTPGKGHANDASRHLLLLMATRGLLPQDILTEFAEMA
jgi:hypothetical protein